MSTASTSAYPIVLGSTFSGRQDSSSRQSLISVKYNFRPPSIANDSVGFLHCKTKNESEWQLEYAVEHGTEEEIAHNAQSFAGPQSSARDVECVLVWDKSRNAYVLDHVTSNFSLKYDRKPAKLSVDARKHLANTKMTSVPRSTSRTSALGLEIEEGELQPEAGIEVQQDDDVAMDEIRAKEDHEEEDDFAMQLQRDLEAFEDHSPEQENEQKESDKPARGHTESSKDSSKTGLGLMTSNGLHDDVITPRGSPYIDRPTKTLGQAAATARIAHSTTNGAQARSTPPRMSPASVANSPRPTGLESSLSATWRPPAQRSAVTLAYGDDEDDEEDSDDEEEEEDDDDDDDDEDEEDDEEESRNIAAAEDVDDDLEAFARELEGSLMEPATPVEEKQPSKSVAARARRSSARGKK